MLSVFAGQRPLIKASHGEKTSKLSRDHTVITSRTNLVTITGGKWTTYRRMGEDAVNHLAEVGSLEPHTSRTANLHLHGYLENAGDEPYRVYGSDWKAIGQLAHEDPSLGRLLHKRLPLPSRGSCLVRAPRDVAHGRGCALAPHPRPVS